MQLLLRDELQLQVRTKYTPPAIQLNQVSTIPQPATPGTLNFAVRIIGVPLTITGCAEIENTENTRSTGSQENFVNTAAGIAISDSEPRENPEHHGNQNVCARNKSQLPHVTIKYLGEFNAQIPFLGKTIETAASKLIPEILRADHDLIMQIAKNKLPIFVAQQ
ncbi:hypothetical protein [Arcanobacterium hippocoleae]|uniref:hypothetical protein n=1 Tax=Arcanobacterium hippocoleae TaxID=149017 RepID=UPI00333E6714